MCSLFWARKIQLRRLKEFGLLKSGPRRIRVNNENDSNEEPGWLFFFILMEHRLEHRLSTNLISSWGDPRIYENLIFPA